MAIPHDRYAPRLPLKNCYLRSTVAALLAVSAVPAPAAETASPASLADVVVTAQKREQNLQDVPISVIALSGDELKAAGVTDIKELTILTPGLTVTSTTSETVTTARIRGIGTVGDNPGLESSVGVVIDGVYRPRNGVGFGNLGEIDRIEVLEGPQGELFGKNNDAGVINIVTKRPSMTFGATGEISFGNYNSEQLSGSVTGPVSSNSAVRLYAGYESRDGFLSVAEGIGPNNVDRANNRNAGTFRGQYLVTPSDAVSLLVIGDFSKRNEVCCQAVPVVAGPFAGIVGALAGTPQLGGLPGGLGTQIPPNPYSYQSFANSPISQQVRDMGLSVQLDWDLGGAKLTSITAWRDNTTISGNDVDYSGAGIVEQPATSANETDFKQFSEELRIAGKAGPLDWLVGGFFSNEILDFNQSILAGPQFDLYVGGLASAAVLGAPNFLLIPSLTGKLPGGTFIPGVSGEADVYSTTAKSYAFFTDETYSVTDRFDITAGLRWTHETKDSTAQYKDPDGGAGCGSLLASPGLAGISPLSPEYQFLLGYGCSTVFNPYYANLANSQSLSESKVTGTVKLSYRFTDQVLGYLSWGSGYKAGGFNLARVTANNPSNPLLPNLDTSFPAETVNSYEVGLKTTSADKTLRANLAVFDQRYEDFQLNTFTGIQFVVSTLPAVESKGASLDVAWLTPVSGLTLSGGVTYAFTNINEFGAALPLFSTARLNDRLSFAPLWSGVVSAGWEHPLSNALTLRINLSEKYSSAYNTGSDLDPEKLQGAYGLLDARIGIGAPDGRWAVELWGHNVTDKGYFQVAFDAPFQYQQIDAFVGDPRTYGATLRVKF
jgi:outer membrane receptor protein involved in Fe transport